MKRRSELTMLEILSKSDVRKLRLELLEAQRLLLCVGAWARLHVWAFGCIIMCTRRVWAHTALINNSAQVGAQLCKHNAEQSFAHSYTPAIVLVARATTIVPGLLLS